MNIAPPLEAMLGADRQPREAPVVAMSEEPDKLLAAAMKAAGRRLAPNVLLAHMALIAEASGYSMIDICGRSQSGAVTGVRRIIARYLRARGCSYPEIGKLLGGRDHTTAIALVKGARKRGVR